MTIPKSMIVLFFSIISQSNHFSVKRPTLDSTKGTSALHSEAKINGNKTLRFEIIVKKKIRDNQPGFRVIAWDGPAHGDSPGSRTNLVEFARLLQIDMDDWPIPSFAVIGHSLGGAAAAYACKMGIQTKNLILLSAPSSLDGVFERLWPLIHLTKKLRTSSFN